MVPPSQVDSSSMSLHQSYILAVVRYQALVARAHQSLPPVFTLPVELLYIIFRMVAAEYIEECGKSVHSERLGWARNRSELLKHPLILGVRHVCRAWRYVASFAPLLWNQILATPFFCAPGEYSRRSKTLRLITLQLELSGDETPISLHLKPMHETEYDWTTSIRQRIYQLDQEVYLALYLKQAPRCKTLSIEFTSFMLQQFEDSLTLSGILFPILETLKIDVPEDKDLLGRRINFSLQISSKTFPALRHLHIINRRASMDVLNLIDVGCLQTFSLSQRDIFPQAVEIIRASKMAKSITLVELHGGSRSLFSVPEQKVFTPHINVPLLEKLVLEGWSSPTDVFGFFIFPNLRVLEVDCESLRDVYDGMRQFITRSQCMLEKLVITHSRLDYEALVSVLQDPIIRKIPNVFIKYYEWSFLSAGNRDEELSKIRNYFSSLNRDNISSSVVESSHRHTGPSQITEYHIIWTASSLRDKDTMDL